MASKTVQLYKKPGVSGNTHYHEDQKLNAVIQYMALGSLQSTATITKIPFFTLRNWKQQDWWKKAEREIRDESTVRTETKLGGLVTKSLNQLEDRLDNGDFNFNRKTGQVLRVPIKANVVNQIAKNAIDKQQMLQNIQSREVFTDKAVEERLKDLALEFMKFASKRLLDTSQDTVIDVEATTLAQGGNDSSTER